MLLVAEIPFATQTKFPAGWRLLDDVQLLELKDPEFLIEAILPRRGVGVLYGPSGACKTTLVAGLMTRLATGPDWFGHRVCERGASVYVATEDASGFKVRLAAAKRAAQLSLTTPIGVYTFPEPIDLRDPVSVGQFSRFLEHQGAALELLVVDTYAGATAGGSENSSEDTTLAMTHAQQWRDRLGLTVLLVHHTNAGGSRERGHSAMRGAADTMISVTPVDDAIHLECSKQRNAAPFPSLLLKLVPVPEGGCVLRLASDVLPCSGLTAIQGKVLAILRDTFAATGATKAEWRSACQDVAERSFHRAAKVLLERGFIRQAGTHFCPTGKETR
jgi:AAA domain